MKRSALLRSVGDYIPFGHRRDVTDLFPLFGVAIGIAAGVGIGMMLAPQTGRETRRQLRDGAHRIKERALGAADRARGRVEQLTHSSEADRSFLNDVGADR